MISRLPPRIARRIVENANGCWLWTGYCVDGYSRITWRGRACRGHRVVYEMITGLAPGPQLHHVCEVRHCVNPAHLESLTDQEHQAKHGRAGSACSFGHEWTPHNTYIRKNGERMCRACLARRQRQRYASLSVEQRQAEIWKSSERRRRRLTRKNGDLPERDSND